MPLAAAGETRVLNGLLSSVFVSLHTADPATTGAGEVTGGSYTRMAAAFTNSGANPTTAANSSAIQFPQATADWGNITHFGIWSAATGGQFLGGDAVVVPKEVLNSDIARWDTGQLKVTAN